MTTGQVGFECASEVSELINCVASNSDEQKCTPLLKKLRACIKKKVRISPRNEVPDNTTTLSWLYTYTTFSTHTPARPCVGYSSAAHEIRFNRPSMICCMLRGSTFAGCCRLQNTTAHDRGSARRSAGDSHEQVALGSACWQPVSCSLRTEQGRSQ